MRSSRGLSSRRSWAATACGCRQTSSASTSSTPSKLRSTAGSGSAPTAVTSASTATLCRRAMCSSRRSRRLIARRSCSRTGSRERRALTTRTPVTLDRLQVWLKNKQQRKEEEEALVMEEAKQSYAKGKRPVISGRALFAIDPSLFIDDDAAGEGGLERE